ncbi:efflux RND transporter periplasmic adaptor subunit, partial [Paenibacillus sepulcri]|nr:efflux RND transporter periplasmic adaptor subunit [Paenibacillus sepulcri]
MRKWWILGIGVLLVAAAGVAYFKWDKKEVVVAAPVATAQVVKGTIEVNVSGTGSIAPAEKETVKSGKQGIIGEVKVKQGDKVKKGDVLATLEGEDNTDKIKTEEVNLEKKLLQLESTQDQYKMETDDKNISSLKLSMKQQQLDIDQSRETIADLKDAVAEETIVAPVSGTVTTLSVADGDTLNGSTELMEIADYDHYEIIVGIDELDISKVKVGQSAKVTVEALADQTFTGKVSEIANEGTANNGVASFDVTVALDTAAGLKSGMSAEASIQVEKKENTLMLPIDAVQSLGGRYMV